MNLRTLKLQGYRITAKSIERGDDLLFCIHGLGCASGSFLPLATELALEEASILAIDLPGFGASEKPETFSYTMEDHAAICEALLEQSSFERLHIVGHSMGGAVGLLLPEARLAAAESFICIEGNLTANDCGVMSRPASSVSFPEFEEAWPSLKSRFAASTFLEQTLPLAFYRSAQSLVSWSDSGKLLSRFLELRCRKCYVYGDENQAHPSVAATRSVPQLEIAGSGHFPMNDNPQALAEELAPFVFDEG